MNKPRLAKVARVRGEFALLVFERAASDDVITGAELDRVEKAFRNAVKTMQAVDAEDAVSRAMGRSTNPRHLNALMGLYQAAVDELPDEMPGDYPPAA